MYTLIDWQTKSIITEEGTDTIQMFDTEYLACTYARSNLHDDLWSVIAIPEYAMFYMD